MVRKLGVNLSRRLMHVNSFSEIIMKESVFNIKLMNKPSSKDNIVKNNMNGSSFDDRVERVIKI